MPVPVGARALGELLRDRGIVPRRRLGQNFLVDRRFLEALVRDMGLRPDDQVVEIGTGAGHWTEVLAAHAGRVWSFEIDADLHRLANEMIGPRPNLTLIRGDGAGFGGRIDPDPDRRLFLAGNLPYSDYARLLVAMMAYPRKVAAIVVMLQRDVADRLRSGPGTAAYGPLPALVQGLHKVEMLRRAGPGLFHPRPRVDSAVLRLQRLEKPPCLPSEVPGRFEGLKRLFRQRRKLLKSVLAVPGEFADRRVGELSPVELLALAGHVS